MAVSRGEEVKFDDLPAWVYKRLRSEMVTRPEQDTVEYLRVRFEELGVYLEPVESPNGLAYVEARWWDSDSQAGVEPLMRSDAKPLFEALGRLAASVEREKRARPGPR